MVDRPRSDDVRDSLVGSSVGKYRIVRVLGSGGMGVLYEARHPVLANRLAIKTLRASLGAEGTERFRNEALAASRLRDDRLPQIFDIDQLEDGTQYIVMEYLEGEDLAHRLARGPMDPGYAARLVLEVLELLAKVHTLGIVHRDIKPANIFIARSNLFGEIPKLLDFGVAHVASSSMTHAGQMLGTPAYMAPEQALDPRRIGPWTDVFAAAVVLYELIAGPGERPWTADSAAGHIAALAGTTPPRALTSVAPWAPPELWDALERGLRRDPAQRYQDALELARAIEPYAADRSVLYRPPAPVAVSAADTSTVVSPVTPARAAVQSPLVAQKVAELREAFGRMRPGTPNRGQPTETTEQLQLGERRLVAVLYAHVQLGQGSGPTLSADDREQLTSQFLDLFGSELAQQGAHVIAQPDGGLIGVFGGEHVREDDAERAIAAALAIRAQREESSWLLADLDATLSLQIGVHRGWVSQRARSGAGMPLGGETIGIARRLAENAPLNAILATSDAIDRQRDWLAVQPLTKLMVPGRGRPVEAHEVLGTMRKASGPEPLAFVGRDRALAALDDAFGSAASASSATVVAITGEPGVGKTRLVSEFLARAAPPPGDGGMCLLRVQPLSRVSYGVWAALVEDMLAGVAALQGGAHGTASVDALASALDAERGALLLQQRPIVDWLLGRGVDGPVGTSPQEMGARIQLALTLCLEATSRLLSAPGRPVIIVLENLHRADPASLSLIAGVMAGLRAAMPPFVVLTMRAALPDELPRHARLIPLGPLPHGDAVALASSLAAPALISPAVHQLVAERAMGNPLFIQQLVAMLREEGLLGAPEAKLRSVAAPVSLYGLFLERVDRLDPALADALRLASVLGVEFEREVYQAVAERAVQAAGPAGTRRTPAAALDELTASGFLARHDSADTGMYAFEQPQMQSAVYGTVLTENRQILHALAAEAIEQRHQPRLARHFARILHHYSQSANIARTVQYARLAGERALAMAAYAEAGEHLGIAAALQDRLPGTSALTAAETLHRLATACEWQGELRQAASRAEEAAERLAAGGPGDRQRRDRQGRIAMTLGELYGLLGSWERSIDSYAGAEACFAEAGMDVEAAEARCCRGFAHRARGQPERGVELAREGWEALEATGNRPAIARAGHELGNLLRDLGRYEEALRIFDRAVASGDDLRGEGRLSESMWGSIAARSGRAMTHAAAGNLPAAIADQRGANELARRDGNQVAQAISEYHLAAHYLEQGEWRASAESAERAYRQAREMDMPVRAFKCRLVQARICIATDDWEGALAHIHDAFAAAERGRIPDDALIDSVELLGSAADHVARAALADTVRTVWAHVSHSGGERLRGSVVALSALLDLDGQITRLSEPTRADTR